MKKTLLFSVLILSGCVESLNCGEYSSTSGIGTSFKTKTGATYVCRHVVNGFYSDDGTPHYMAMWVPIDPSE